MSYSFKSYPELNCVELEDTNYNIKCITFERTPKSSVLAYLAARYSRSDKSIIQTCKDLVENDTIESVSSKRLEDIFHNYGHKSVADQAEIILCLEGIPNYTAEVLFNWCPVYSGQARSTRYQDFTNTENLESLIVDLPSDLNLPTELYKNYQELNLSLLNDFKELHQYTLEAHTKVFNPSTKKEEAINKSRALDTSRYLLPLGLRTSLALFISARQLSDLLCILLGSSNTYNVATANLIFNLLTNDEFNYNKQAESLIRHVIPDYTQYSIEQQLVNLVKGENITPIYEYNKSITDSIYIESQSSYMDILTHAVQLTYPRLMDIDFDEDLDINQVSRLIKSLSEIIFENSTDRNLPGNITQNSSIAVYGLMDIGSARDFNRHRSVKRFLPYLSDLYPTYQDIHCDNVNSIYTLSPYFDIDDPVMELLKITFDSTVFNHYQNLKLFCINAKRYNLDNKLLDEYLKYCLPFGHLINYAFHFDINSLIYTTHLRTKPGGHIAYRLIAQEWVLNLCEDEFFSPLNNNITYVDVNNREDYYTR